MASFLDFISMGLPIGGALAQGSVTGMQRRAEMDALYGDMARKDEEAKRQEQEMRARITQMEQIAKFRAAKEGRDVELHGPNLRTKTAGASLAEWGAGDAGEDLGGTFDEQYDTTTGATMPAKVVAGKIRDTKQMTPTRAPQPRDPGVAGLTSAFERRRKTLDAAQPPADPVEASMQARAIKAGKLADPMIAAREAMKGDEAVIATEVFRIYGKETGAAILESHGIEPPSWWAAAPAGSTAPSPTPGATPAPAGVSGERTPAGQLPAGVTASQLGPKNKARYAAGKELISPYNQ